MKRIRPLLVLVLVLSCIFAPMAWAAARSSSAPADRSPAAPLAHAFTTITGIAISPLLGTGALGAYQWLAAKDAAARDALPWYAQPKFWVPALLIVLVCALKDSFGAAVPPMLKKPLDVLEVAENKFSGLIAAGAVVPFAMDTFTKLFLEAALTTPPLHGNVAMMPSLAVNWAPFLDVLTIPFGIAVFAVVWMASHAINVLILLSPWGTVDAGLKAARTGLLGLLTITATMNPWLAALLSLVVLVVAYLVAGWAFRLTLFGSIMCWEFFTRRRRRFTVAGSGDGLFSGAAFGGVPVRTYGRLQRDAAGTLTFTYRPWLVLQPQTVAVPVAAADIAVGVGMFFSIVLRNQGGTLFLLPPRYRGHEQRLAETYAFGGGVQPAGLRRAWSGVKELIGGRAAPTGLPEAATSRAAG